MATFTRDPSSVSNFLLTILNLSFTLKTLQGVIRVKAEQAICVDSRNALNYNLPSHDKAG